MYEWKGGPTQPRKKNWLSILFVILAAIGFAGMFFVAGASDANTITLTQLTYLCAGSAAAMGLGIVGYMICGEAKIK